ncbi:uncharacterized protein METZ01_LOCUS485226, partial [marine metagenome]
RARCTWAWGTPSPRGSRPTTTPDPATTPFAALGSSDPRTCLTSRYGWSNRLSPTPPTGSRVWVRSVWCPPPGRSPRPCTHTTGRGATRYPWLPPTSRSIGPTGMGA